MNSVQKLGAWLFNIKPQREIVRNLSDEEFLREKGINESLKRENINLKRTKATLEQQLSETRAKENQKKEKENKLDVDNQIAKNLNEQKSVIDNERYGRWASWTKLEKKRLRDKKFAKNFIFTDKDGETIFSPGELLFSSKGFFGITDSNGKLIHVATDLRNLIHKPESIFNQFKFGRIQLARDKNGDYLDGIDDQCDDFINYVEIDVPIWDEEKNSYANSKFFTDNFRKKFIEIQDKLRELKDKYKTMEIVVSDLREENSDVKRANEVLLHENKNGKTAVSEALASMRSQSMELSDITKKISSLTENNILYEQELNVYKEKTKKLMEIIESTGDVTNYQKAMAVIKSAVEFTKLNTIIIEKETEKSQPKQTPQLPR